MVKSELSVANRLNREKGTNTTYKNLLERSGPLNKKNKYYARDIFTLALALNKKNKYYARDIFTLALAYGYMKNIKLPIETKDNFLNAENFGKNLPSLINALAITKSEKGIHILAEDSSEIFDVAEQYANGGLDFLNSAYVGSEDDFIETLRIHILKLNKDDKIMKKIEEMDL